VRASTPVPEPMAIGDGEVVLFNPDGFQAKYNAVAVMVRDGGLFVLQEGESKFTNVEFINKKLAGSLSAAKFRTFQWPVAEAPAGMRIFACQHKTRETVWIPELMQHANGARRLKQVLLVAPEPAMEAAHLARLIDGSTRTESDGAIAVPSGDDRADFVFMSREQLGQRYPGVALAGLPERGAVGLVIAADLGKAEKALGAAAVRSGQSLCVPPASANGTLLAFVLS